MSGSGGQHGIYHVSYSAAVAETFKRLQRRARELGIGEMVLAAIKTIFHRLQNEPLIFGEPLFHLPALQLEVRVGIVSPIVVHYAVHAENE